MHAEVMITPLYKVNPSTCQKKTAASVMCYAEAAPMLEAVEF